MFQVTTVVMSGRNITILLLNSTAKEEGLPINKNESFPSFPFCYSWTNGSLSASIPEQMVYFHLD